MPANKTLWIIGDALMMEAAGHYNRVKRDLLARKMELSDTDNVESGDNKLYIDENYAVKVTTPGINNVSSIPAIVANTFVDLLNENPKLPHSLIIAVDDYKFWNDRDLLASEMKWILKKFMKEMIKIAELRKLALHTKAVDWESPRFFITRPLPLPNNMPSEFYPKGFRANRRRFCKLLDRVATKCGFEQINLPEFQSNNDKQFFDKAGEISEKGFTMFWISISDAVHKVDDRHQIQFNKRKAKRLAQAIAASASKIDGNESGIEKLPDSDSDQDPTSKGNTSTKETASKITRNSPRRVPKRSLQKVFDSRSSSPQTRNEQPKSPSHKPDTGSRRPKPPTHHK